MDAIACISHALIPCYFSQISSNFPCFKFESSVRTSFWEQFLASREIIIVHRDHRSANGSQFARRCPRALFNRSMLQVYAYPEYSVVIVGGHGNVGVPGRSGARPGVIVETLTFYSSKHKSSNDLKYVFTSPRLLFAFASRVVKLGYVRSQDDREVDNESRDRDYWSRFLANIGSRRGRSGRFHRGQLKSIRNRDRETEESVDLQFSTWSSARRRWKLASAKWKAGNRGVKSAALIRTGSRDDFRVTF